MLVERVGKNMKKLVSYGFIAVIIVCLVSGCGNTMKESVFECVGKTDTSTKQVILTYKEVNGEKIFYDGDKEIGTRIKAISYAEEKTGMYCKSGSDR